MYSQMSEEEAPMPTMLPRRASSTAASRRNMPKIARRRVAGSMRSLRSIIVEDEFSIEEKPVMKTLFKKQQKGIPTGMASMLGSAGFQPQQQHRSWLYTVLNHRSSQPQAIAFKAFVTIVVIVDVGFFVASTDDQFSQDHSHLLTMEEGIVSSIFLVEYICRVIVIPESSKYGDMSPTEARLRHIFTYHAMVDAIATFTFFVQMFVGIGLPKLSYLRFFRLTRILKTSGFARSLDAIYRVVYYNREILYVAFNICILMVLVTAILMYYMRPRDDQESVQFNSLLKTMYLSAMMLTGQGGPEDQDELPWYTKVIVLLTGAMSVAVFAIPASLLTWGFEAEATRMAKRAKRKQVQKANASYGDETYRHLSSSSSENGDTTDEEYFNIVLGADQASEENDGGVAEADPMQRTVADTRQGDFAGSRLDFGPLIEENSMASAMPNDITQLTLGVLVRRVETLETQLKTTNEKLDQIMLLLNPVNR